LDHNFSCEYGRVILRPLIREDIESLRQLRNQPQIRKWFNYSKEISKEEQMKWFESYLLDQTDYMFTVVLKSKPEQFIGTYAAYNFDIENKTIEVGRLMIDSMNISERGLGFDVVSAAFKLVFENLPVDIITAEQFADNERALRSNLQAGFKITSVKTREEREIIYLAITRDQYSVSTL
jgi:RimJ/RimL family protein N-acetyltransferase